MQEAPERDIPLGGRIRELLATTWHCNSVLVETVFLSVAYSLLLLLLWREAAELFSTTIWQHDALIYLDSYTWKLRVEGRWLNYFLFTPLRLVPPALSAICSFACLGFFGYACGSALVPPRYAGLFALACLQIPPFFAQIAWPLTPLPSYLLLGIAPLFRRHLDYRLFFLVFGILFGGAFNNFYNLLPLLFLGALLRGQRRFLPLALWWIAGFLAGYAGAEVMTWLVTRDTIHVEGWRNRLPPADLHSIIANGTRSVRELRWLLSLCALPLLLALGCGLLAAADTYRRDGAKPLHNLLCTVTLCCLVMLATHAQSFAYGLGVELRTSIPWFLGLLALVPLLCRRLHLLIPLLLCSISLGFFASDMQQLRYHRIVTQVYYDHLQAIAIDPRLYRCAFLASITEMEKADKRIKALNGLSNPLGEGFAHPNRWVPVARAAGFGCVTIGSAARERLDAVLTPSWHTNALYAWTISGCTVFIRFNPAFLSACP